jgi:hypothetical protein
VVRAYRVNDVETPSSLSDLLIDGLASTSGTLWIFYDESEDKVYLSNESYDPGDADDTITGLVKGTWNASSLYVAVGATVQNSTVEESDLAFLDNFELTSGTTVPVPEPGSLMLLLAGATAPLFRRRRA